MTSTAPCELPTSFPSPSPGLAGTGEETFFIPASLEQSRYWMLAQIDPGSTASNMAISFEIEGTLDPALLERCLTALSLRHESLRTLFRSVDGQLSQVIVSGSQHALTFADLTRHPENNLDEAISKLLSEQSHTVVDLQNGPTIHAKLIRVREQRHILGLTMNHIVCDGWSNGVLLRDFTTLYQAFRDGHDPQLPELPFQFADFSLWQTEYLNSPRAAEALEFWRQHFAHDLLALDLPADHPRKPGRSFPGHIESQLMPAGLDQQLQAFCKTKGSTKHIVLLAAFQALCARFSGQWKFLLGSTIANRTQPGMEHVVGRFANPQIIVADLDGNPSFASLEARIREWETNAYTHQDLPFSRILEEFQLHKGGAASQFLQAWFIYQKAFMQPQQAGELRITPRRSVSGGVDFDLFLSVVERNEGPRVQIEYNTDLYSARRIQSFLAAFLCLLEDALLHPETAISDLALERPAVRSASQHGLPAIERRGQQPASDITSPLASEVDVFARLTQHARLRGDSTAIQAAPGARGLTWSELEERSNAVAHRLVELDVVPGSAVVLQLAPCAEAIVSALGILKAGACPVPVALRDVPGELQLAQFAAGALLIVAERSLTGDAGCSFEEFASLPARPHGLPDRSVPGAWLRLIREPGASARTAAIPLELSAHLAEQTALRLGMTGADALLSSFPARSIDLWSEMLMSIMTGASLTFSAELSSPRLQAFLDEKQITWMMAEPQLWRRLIQGGWRGDRRLHAIVRGRASATMSVTNLHQLVHSSWILFQAANAGGPIATSQTATGTELSVATSLPHLSLQVKDAHGARVPSGASGTLHQESLCGPTEWLAQAQNDGSFRILGSSDEFVQHHGMRIHLAEIRDVLLTDFSVADAEAMLSAHGVHRSHEPQPGKEAPAPTLLAYVSPADDARLSIPSLRKRLAAALPSYMVPAEIVEVPQLPRQSDGGLALEQVQQFSISLPAVAAAEDSALDDVERQVAELWKEILGSSTLDPHATFFEAGGNSLLLVRLFARINKAFNTKMPITTIFDAGTVKELAASLRRNADIGSLVAVNREGSKRPLFMIHSYLLYQGLSRVLGEDQPFYGLRELEQDGDLSIEDRVAHYVEEIRRIQPEGPYAVAGWCAAGPLTVEVARQLADAGEEMDAVILFDSWLPGYLESIEGDRQGVSWLLNPAVIMSRFRHFQSKTGQLSARRKIQYLTNSLGRIAREGRDRLFIRHWSQLHSLSTRFHMPLPQFMYNTSLKTFAALQQYRERLVPIQLTLVRASDSREVKGAGPACGWDRVAEKGVNVVWAPGSHETMFVGRNLEATAAIVRATLEPASNPSFAQEEEAQAVGDLHGARRSMVLAEGQA